MSEMRIFDANLNMLQHEQWKRRWCKMEWRSFDVTVMTSDNANPLHADMGSVNKLYLPLSLKFLDTDRR